jgi:hypothetical protein
MDALGLAALALITLEWMALGWLSGVDWPREPMAFWAPRWALRLLVGSFLGGLAQLVLALVGLGFGGIPLVLAVAAVGAGALRLVAGKRRAEGARAERRGDPAPRPKQEHETWATNRLAQEPPAIAMVGRERLGWLLLGAILLGATVRSFSVPEAGWDAYSHWGLRAQAFALAGTIVNAHSEHEYYPPLVPLLEAWLYLHRGGPTIDLGKTVWAVIGSAFGVCLAWHLRLSLRLPWLAPVLATGIMLGTTALIESFWTGQADLALTAALTLATLAIVQWQRSAHPMWLVQAGIFAAMAALTKFEGTPRLGVVIVALLVEAVLARSWKSARPAFVLTATAGLATVLWTTFQLTRGITPNAEHVGELQPLAFGSVLVALAAVFGGVRTGGGLLVAVLAWAVAGRQLVCPPLRLPAMVVVGQLAATMMAFLLSSTSPDIEVRTSATRLFAQFLPLALFVGAVGLCAETATYNRRGR